MRCVFRKWMSLMLAFCLLLGLGFALSEQDVLDEGDDSEVVPMEIAEEEDDSEVVPIEAAEEEAEAEDPSDEGDDSEVVPVDLMEDDELEEEILDSRILQYGDEGDDVLELQTRLKELYYYTGNLSGRFREGTREAVKAFQGDFDLEATGVADVQTQSLLFSTLYRPLRYGSTGEDVKDLQTRLTELGYYKGKISGNYLEGTRSAVTSRTASAAPSTAQINLP